MNPIDILVIGGGAAGFFTAINCAEKYPNKTVVIVERGKEVLTKVKVSGGGRCNLTHACFNPSELIHNYPRGEKELLGPFHQFCCGDTMAWFEEHGVPLKIEEDGRIFPKSNSSQTIINCFLNEARKYGVEIKKSHAVKGVSKAGNLWNIVTNQGIFQARKLVITTGSSPKMWKLIEQLGHTIVSPVPSLFTFHCKDFRIKELAGITTNVSVEVIDSKLASEGPLLITHWGMSGPAILKLSAWGARELFKKKYQFQIKINWLSDISKNDCLNQLKELKTSIAKKQIVTGNPFQLPKRFWQRVVKASKISETIRWADMNKLQLEELASQLTEAIFTITGKSTFKEEFVTAGGIDLKEINFKTFASRKQDNLYFAGEILNIDAITGGFNFQNAWTGSYVIANSI